MCKKSLLLPEDMGRAELRLWEHRLPGVRSVHSLLHTKEITPFLGKEEKITLWTDCPPLLPARSPAAPRWPPAAKGSHCQLEAKPAPGWEWIYIPLGVGHHMKNISREEAGKDS